MVKDNSKGLGDVIESITTITGIKSVVGDCVACKERKERLNRKYPNLKNAREFTKTELKYWRNFMKVRKALPEEKVILEICVLYSEILSLPYWEPVKFNHSGTITSLSSMIDKLDIIYKNQTK